MESDPYFLSLLTSHDVASHVCQTLATGWKWRGCANKPRSGQVDIARPIIIPIFYNMMNWVPGFANPNP